MYKSINNYLKKNGYFPQNIFDIGAQKGNWTKDIMLIYPNSNYYLFEAINYSELDNFKNKNNCKVFNTILNDKNDTVDWYENKDTGDSIFKEISHYYSNVKPIKRESKILNDLIKEDLKNILIKIDCQGAEIPILKGANNLYNNIDFIILEIPLFGNYNNNVPNFLEHIKFMDSIGFIVYDFIESHIVNNFNMQVDIMFINKNHSFNKIVQDRLQIKNFNIQNMKTVAFLTNKLTLRGTEVAIYDYADYNEKILGNHSIIICRDYDKNKKEPDVDSQAYDKFNNRFPVFYYENQKDIDKIVLNNNISHLVIIKSGENDGLVSNYCKNIILCVFNVSQPHGQVYTPISHTVNLLHGKNYPVTPHIVTLPDCNDNLRKELNIPEDAIVFGRYGGLESFDISFVHDVIKNVLNKTNNIYFLFMNTNKFYEHKNIIYLNGTSDMLYKRKFINSCDALIHARQRGETFGLTCGEFSICKKPVITWGGSVEREHLVKLKDKAIIYNNPEELENILTTFYKNKYNVDENNYMLYTPENVMKIFNNNCLI